MANKMTIGIDASRTTLDKKTGIELYSNEIIKRLIKYSDYNFLLWSNQKAPTAFTPLPANVEWKLLKASHLWSQYKLALELLTHRSPDVIFIPSHVIPIVNKGRFVVTIHDLAFKYFPEIYSSFDKYYHNLAIKTAIKTARKIIVPSEATKNDLIRFYKTRPDRIAVIPHGVDHDRFKPAKKTADLPFGINRDYILFTGRVESKKNLVNLIKAYGLLRQESKISHQLVLVGKPGYGYSEIQREIDNLPPNIKDSIIETGYVRDNTLLTLLQNADIFVFPSLYEGFGLPVLEAMACGIPVVSSKTSSLIEVVKDAGILADPKKPFAFAAALSRLIHHPNEKNELIKKGLVHVKLYNWDTATDQTLSVIKQAAQKS